MARRAALTPWNWSTTDSARVLAVAVIRLLAELRAAEDRIAALDEENTELRSEVCSLAGSAPW
jgi:hypothetical protein